MRRRALAGPLVVASLLVAGCSGGAASTSTGATSPPTESTASPERRAVTTIAPSPSTTVPTVLAVRLDHYAIEPDTLHTAAGSFTLAANNIDGVPHDVTLIRTGLAADQLPTTDIRIDETSPDIEILGRTPRLWPRREGIVHDVACGRGVYRLACKVPHHYVREAMVATLTVA